MYLKADILFYGFHVVCGIHYDSAWPAVSQPILGRGLAKSQLTSGSWPRILGRMSAFSAPNLCFSIALSLSRS